MYQCVRHENPSKHQLHTVREIPSFKYTTVIIADIGRRMQTSRRFGEETYQFAEQQVEEDFSHRSTESSWIERRR